MTSEDIFDVTIIGGGPAGLFSAFYSGLREMKTKVIEYKSTLGGKVHVYPEKMIWDAGGLTPITGSQFIEQLVEQGNTFQPKVITNEKVTSILKTDMNLFQIITLSGQSHFSKTVILATGSGILKPKNIEIENAKQFEGSNLHYTVQSLRHFKDKVVVISGGGNAAIDWANELAPIAKKIYLIYRKEVLLNTTIKSVITSPRKDAIHQVVLEH